LEVDIAAPTGCPPVTLQGRGGFAGDRVSIDSGISSQYTSALLMMAACGRGPVAVSLVGANIGARGYIELTLAVMTAFGACATRTGAGAWRVEPTGYGAADFLVEPD